MSELEEHNAKEISKIYDVLISITQRLDMQEHLMNEHIIPALKKTGMIKVKKEA